MALDDAEERILSLAFADVRRIIETKIRNHPDAFVSQVRGGKRPEIMMYFMIANTAGDHAESGEFHIYRGMLDLRGEAFLKVFNGALDHLVELNAISLQHAKEQRKQLAARIEAAG